MNVDARKHAWSQNVFSTKLSLSLSALSQADYEFFPSNQTDQLNRRTVGCNFPSLVTLPLHMQPDGTKRKPTASPQNNAVTIRS